MSNTIDVQATVTPEPETAPTMAIATRPAQAVGAALTIDELHKRLEFIRQVMRNEMKEGQDFGKIPGTGDKPSLLQPGAQKLLMTFNLREQVKKETMRELPHSSIFGHREYELTITVFPSGLDPSQGWDGVGTCSTFESKYRYRKAERVCPTCKKPTIIAEKAEYCKGREPGFVCWKKKGGCGALFHAQHPEILSQSAEDVENEDPADCWNTVRKMAFKRALVAAAINATNTSELWTQDVEDMVENRGSGVKRGSAQDFASSCPVIALFSVNDYTYLLSLSGANPRNATPEESQILLKRLSESRVSQSVSFAQPDKPPCFLKYSGGDLRITGEHRFIGKGLRGFQGLIACVLLRPDSVQRGQGDQGGGVQGVSNQGRKTELSQTQAGEVRSPGGSGATGNPLPGTSVRQAKQAIFADQDTLKRLLGNLRDCLDLATEYFRKLENPCVLLPNEHLTQLPLEFVPVTRRQFEKLMAAITDFGNGGEAKHAFAPNPLPPGKAPANKQKAPPKAAEPDKKTWTERETPSDHKAEPPAKQPPPPSVQAAKAKDPEWFFDVVCPIPNKGQKRDEYMKNPDTIGSLYHDMKGGDQAAQKRLWGFAKHWNPEPREFKGKVYPVSDADRAFREALDSFCEWEEKHGKDTVAESESSAPPGGWQGAAKVEPELPEQPEQDDDLPF